MSHCPFSFSLKKLGQELADAAEELRYELD